MKDQINIAFNAAIDAASDETLRTFLFELSKEYPVTYDEDIDISSVIREIKSFNKHENEFTTVNLLAILVNLIGEEK